MTVVAAHFAVVAEPDAGQPEVAGRSSPEGESLVGRPLTAGTGWASGRVGVASERKRRRMMNRHGGVIVTISGGAAGASEHAYRMGLSNGRFAIPLAKARPARCAAGRL